MLFEGLLELVAVDAVVVELDGEYLRVIQVEGLQRGEVAGLLDDDLVARVDKAGGDHVQSLLRAVGNNYVFGSIVQTLLRVAVGNKLAQGHIALGVAVLQGTHAVPLQHLGHGSFHLLDGEGIRVRQAAGKGYYGRITRGGKYARSEIPLKVGLGHAVGNPEFHFAPPLLCGFAEAAATIFYIAPSRVHARYDSTFPAGLQAFTHVKKKIKFHR